MLLASIFVLIVAGAVIRFGTANPSSNQFYTSRSLNTGTAINFLEKSSDNNTLQTLFKILNGATRYTLDRRVELATEDQKPKTKNGIKILAYIFSRIDIPMVSEDTSLSEDFSSAIECYVKTSHFPGG
jgi:hypothetical protein